MSYVIIERRNGDVKVTRRGDDGKAQVLADIPHRSRKANARTVSGSNGFIGDARVLADMKRLDAELGVGDKVKYIETHASHTPDGRRVAAFRAEFDSRPDRKNWLRAHKRVDYDASYSDPTPGDFSGKAPREFE